MILYQELSMLAISSLDILCHCTKRMPVKHSMGHRQSKYSAVATKLRSVFEVEILNLSTISVPDVQQIIVEI